MNEKLPTMKNRQIFLILLILLIGFSCSNKEKNELLKENEELHIVLDNLLRYYFFETSLIQQETEPIFTGFEERNDCGLCVPPPPNMTIISKHFFNAMIERNKIDSIDAKNMYSRIDSTKIHFIEFQKINKNVISKNELDEIYKNSNEYESPYDFIESKYGSRSYLKIGTPIFNNNLTKLVLTVDYHCGGLCGQGYIFLLAKENENWRILEILGTWES